MAIFALHAKQQHKDEVLGLPPSDEELELLYKSKKKISTLRRNEILSYIANDEVSYNKWLYVIENNQMQDISNLSINVNTLLKKYQSACRKLFNKLDIKSVALIASPTVFCVTLVLILSSHYNSSHYEEKINLIYSEYGNYANIDLDSRPPTRSTDNSGRIQNTSPAKLLLATGIKRGLNDINTKININNLNSLNEFALNKTASLNSLPVDHQDKLTSLGRLVFLTYFQCSNKNRNNDYSSKVLPLYKELLEPLTHMQYLEPQLLYILKTEELDDTKKVCICTEMLMKELNLI